MVSVACAMLFAAKHQEHAERAFVAWEFDGVDEDFLKQASVVVSKQQQMKRIVLIP